MPPLLDLSGSSSWPVSNISMLSQDLGYEYPEDRDFRPGSVLHDRLVSEIMIRAQNSRNAIKAREQTWDKLERTLTAYVPLSDEEMVISVRIRVSL